MMAVRATKKSLASDRAARLKERLVRGERLTEQELVELETAAVNKYKPIISSQPQPDKATASASTSLDSTSTNQLPQPQPPQRDALDQRARPVFHAKSGKTQSPPPQRPPSSQPPQSNATSLTHAPRPAPTLQQAKPTETEELRNLRFATEKERATLDVTANELARLRQLRLAATEDPQVALNISTDEIEAARNAVTTQASMPAAPVPVPPPVPGPVPAPVPLPKPTTEVLEANGRTDGSKSREPASSAVVLPVPASAANDLETDYHVPNLRIRLASNHAKVLDLFRSYDVDGAGTVRKVEMRRAVHSLGLEPPPSAIDALFESFHRDEGGGLDYRELCRVLRNEDPNRPPEPEAHPVNRDPRPSSSWHWKPAFWPPPATPAVRSRGHSPAGAPAASSTDIQGDASTNAAPPPASAPQAASSMPTHTGTVAKSSGTRAKPVKQDLTTTAQTQREMVILELLALVETAAPWAAWRASESLRSVPGLEESCAKASAGGGVAIPAQLPPTRSMLSDTLSCAACLMLSGSVYMVQDMPATDTSVYMQVGLAVDPSNGQANLLPLHTFAFLTWLLLLVTLVRQLCARLCKPFLTGNAITMASGGAPLLPLSSPTSIPPAQMPVAAPFAHWTTVAVSEGFLVSYAACWALPSQTSIGNSTSQAAATTATEEALILAWRLGSAHTLAAGASGLFLASASWRSLLMLLWHCRCMPGFVTTPTVPAAPIAHLPLPTASKGAPAVAAAPAPTVSGTRAPAPSTWVTRCNKLCESIRRLVKLTPKGKDGASGRAKSGSAIGAGVAGGGKGRRVRSATPPPKSRGKASGGGRRDLL